MFTLIIFPSLKKPWNLFKSLFSISFHSNKALRLFETGLIFAPEISWTRQNFFLVAIQIVWVFVSLQFPRRHCWIKQKKEADLEAKKTKIYQWQRRKEKLLVRTESLENHSWRRKKMKTIIFWRSLSSQEVIFTFKIATFIRLLTKLKERSNLVGFICHKRCWKRAKTTHWHASKKSILILLKNSCLCFHEQEL